MVKKIIFLTVVLIVVVTFSACSPGYVIKGAWEEVKILSRREEISEILESKKLTEVERTKLELVMAAREFAVSKGLSVGGSYSQYATVDSSSLVWVLTAAPRFKLEPLTWWFPIVGAVPYKGFFSKEDALKLKNELESKGFDVFVRSSSAFSTLGWFNDPVLSTMLQGDEVSLIETVIHEIFHRTLWIPGSAEFNESLANYVGGELAKEFFNTQTDQKQFALASSRQEEEYQFSQFIFELSDELEKLYKSNSLNMGAEKQEILEKARMRWDSRPNKISNFYSLEKFPLSNASIIGLRVYLRGLADFNLLYSKYDNDFAKFLYKLKSLDGNSTDELFEAVKSAAQK